MNIEYLKKNLGGIIKDVVYLREIGSTNDFAKQKNVDDDVLILTSSQLSGRGRFERHWDSEKYNDIAMSLTKSFNIPQDDLFLVTFYTSYSVLQALKIFCGKSSNRFSLKWPNDVLLNGKKVCGILIDMSDIKQDYKKLIIGIGINVNRRFFDKEINLKATSLFNEFSRGFALDELISAIIKYFYENILLLNKKEKLISLWKAETEMIGKQALIRVSENSNELKCKIVDIENDGGIKVEIENEVCFKYFSGDVSVLESY